MKSDCLLQTSEVGIDLDMKGIISKMGFPVHQLVGQSRYSCINQGSTGQHFGRPLVIERICEEGGYSLEISKPLCTPVHTTTART